MASGFVGRAKELEALDRIGTPSLILVEGMAGVGKTRLLEEWSRDRPALWARCPRLREPVPLAPIAELVRSAAGLLAPQLPQNFLYGALRAVIPEFSEQLPSALAERIDLFRAIRQLLGEAQAPIVIDDLQHIDPESLDLLSFLLTDPPGELKLVLAYRPDELPASGRPLGDSPVTPPRLTIRTVRVEPLTEAEVTEWAGPGVYEQTSGLPRIVQDVLAGSDSRWLKELLFTRLDALSSECRAVIGAIAVSASSSPDSGCPISELEGMSAVPKAAVRAALIEALDAGVLTERDIGRYGFPTPLAARTAYDQLNPVIRIDLHERIIEAIPDSDHARIAFHSRECGRSEQWMKHAELAAADATTDGRVEVAIGLLEEILGSPDLSLDTRARLALELARVSVIGLRSDQTASELRKILADERLPVVIRGEVRLDLGLLLCNQLGDIGAGLDELERAVPELEERPDLAARAMSALAMPYFPRGEIADHLRWIERAMEQAQAGANPLVDRAVHANLASLRMVTGSPEEAEALVRKDTGPDASVAERQQTARGLTNLADLATWVGHYAQAETLLAEGVALGMETGASFHASNGQGTAVRLDFARGRWDGLEQRAQATVAANNFATGSEARLVLGMLALARGAFDDTAQHLDEAGISFPGKGVVPVVDAAMGVRIRLLQATDGHAEATRLAETLLERLQVKGIWTWGSIAFPAMAGALELPTAKEFAVRIRAELRGREAPSALASLPRCQAIIDERSSRHASAARLYRQAEKRYDELSQRYDALLCLEGYARCLLADGKADTDWITALSTAQHDLAALGATWDAARCRRLLREHGVSATEQRSGRPGYGSELSPREREVAAMAAEGRTNKEIAAALFLSPRTVEQHVARALRKLGLHSRAELAAGLGRGS